MQQSKIDLNTLLLKAQSYPAQSQLRRCHFDRFYSQLLRSPSLLRPHKSKVIAAYYDEVYETTLQNVGTYLFQKLDSYDPARSDVVSWVNYLLNVRFYDALKVVHPKYSHSKIAIYYNLIPDCHADRLSTDTSDDQDLIQELFDFIETDPDGTLRQSHLKGKPEANFQVLLLKRRSHSWEELAEEFTTSVSTLSSFYRRSLKKFAPLFHQTLCPQI